jgi:fused signal recognition particle receptor
MTVYLVVGVAVVVLAIIAAVVVRLRRRRRAPEVRRDAAPTSPAPALGGGLAPTRAALSARIGSLLGRGVDEQTWTELEEALVAADVGVTAAMGIVARAAARAPHDAVAAHAALRAELAAAFPDRDRSLRLAGDPAVIVVVGVNGSGKTTTIAKLAARLEDAGRPTLLGAADTFRAAATEQLSAWAGRLGLEVVAGQQGADPAAVAFDAFSAARARRKGAVIVDTAGRLHSKANLMAELGKVLRVLRREAGDVGEVLLVLDGTTGQNGVAQARAFTEAVGVTGAVVTKLDGTARGGVAVAVESELAIPVKFIGVGERVEDLVPFDPEAFVEALLEDP